MLYELCRLEEPEKDWAKNGLRVTILLFSLILNIAIFGAKFGIGRDCYKSACFGRLR